MPLMAEVSLVVEEQAARKPKGYYGKQGAYASAYGLFNMAFAGGCLAGRILRFFYKILFHTNTGCRATLGWIGKFACGSGDDDVEFGGAQCIYGGGGIGICWWVGDEEGEYMAEGRIECAYWETAGGVGRWR